MQFKKFSKRIISSVIIVSHLGVITVPAMAAVQESFARAKPGTEGSVSQSDLEKMSELVKGLKQRTAMLSQAASANSNQAKSLLSKRQQLEQTTAQDILNLRVGIRQEVQQQLAELAVDGDHIKAKKLPAIILQRHAAVVKKIEQRQTVMDGLFAQLEQAQLQKSSQARQIALDKINQQIEQWEPKKLQTDYRTLPWGSPSSVVPKPINAETLVSLGRYMKLNNLNGEQLTLNPALTQKDPSQMTAQELWSNALPTLGKSTSIGQWQTISLTGMTQVDQNKWPVLASLPAEAQPADLAANEDVQITPEIQALADQLDHNPAKIYKWVYDNIVYIPTYGSIQGSAYTMETKRGNAFDTSSLLIALLRASKIPARYVYGTINVPAAAAKDWVGGVNNLSAAGNLMGQGGIPSVIMTSGGKEVAMRMEHVWVEAKVDYLPSRGAVQSKTNNSSIPDSWVPLDASYKRYERTAGIDLKTAVPLDTAALINDAKQGATIDESTGSVQNLNQTNVQTALTSYQSRVETYIQQQHPNATVGDILGTSKIKTYNSKMLSPVLPYQVVAVVRDYQTLPDNMRHYFNLNMYGSALDQQEGSPTLTFKIASTKLQGKPLALSFRPTSQADADAIASYLPKPDASGNIDPTKLPKTLPSYAINVTAEITLNGQLLKTGQSYPLGTEIQAQMGFTSPNKNWGLPNKQFNAGEYHAIGYDMQGLSKEQMLRTKAQLQNAKAKIETKELAQVATLTRHDMTGAILQAVVQSYLGINDSQNLIAANQTNIVQTPYMSFGTFSTHLQGVYSWGVLRQAVHSGMMMDIDRISASSADKDNNNQNWVKYNQAIGGVMSANEHSVPEMFFNSPDSTTKNVEGISAIKALQIAAQSGQKIYQIDSSNINAILPQLNHESATLADIRNAVAAGKTVAVSQSKVSLSGWTGSGYIILDPNTGAGAYMISGGSDGGAIKEVKAWLSGFDYVLTGFEAAGLAIAKATIILSLIKLCVDVIDVISNCGFGSGALIGLLTIVVLMSVSFALIWAIAAAATFIWAAVGAMSVVWYMDQLQGYVLEQQRRRYCA